jgi:hypothetical protein
MPKEYVPDRRTIFDNYRLDTTYRGFFNDPQNIYDFPRYGKPNWHVYKPWDNKPGMIRALDFTPSTDEGQKILDYQARV